MNHSKNADVKALLINAIEGVPTRGGAFHIKPLLQGELMSILEVHLQPGVASETHAHDHESLVYVVRGKIKTIVGGEVLVLGPGDVGRHPQGVAHSVEALEEALFLEIKSPAPDIASVLAS